MSYIKRNPYYSFVIMVFILGVSKVLSAFKDIIIAKEFGISPDVDLYYYMFNVVNTPVSIFFTIITMTLIPTLVGGNKSISDVNIFKWQLIISTLVLSLPVCIVTYVFISKSNIVLVSDEFYLSVLMVATIPFGMLFSLFSAFIMSRNGYRNSALEWVPSVMLVLSIFLFKDKTTIEVLVYGTLIGFAFYTFVLIPLDVGKVNLVALSRYDEKLWKLLLNGIGILAFAQALMSITILFDQYFASLVSQGSLSALNYSNKIISLVLTLGGVAITRTLLPMFSNSNSKHRDLMKWLGLMFFSGVVISMFSIYCSEWIVRIVYFRGGFTLDDVISVQEIFEVSSMQYPFYFCGLVLTSYFSSEKNYYPLLISAFLALLIKLVFNNYYLDEYGVLSISWSTVVMYTANFVLFFLFFLFRMKV
ncbi:lipid II flippase MurJ [Vibrio sp. LaRot3]|uniref:lipid II flippase MurJ n=1 Tax=Vibrio sp. LaRot3 TaxID=2998829 RepID=UPI0022CDCB66|nr:lipid II flippase MurJ [Vibrio sp. LaRot3]MDA0149397.1 hypothetical protein [Vibrio sp. LaRot3]